MANKFKPISISLSPNVETVDVKTALRLLFQPWQWQRGPAVFALEEEFKRYLGVKHAVSFNSGRSAFFAILKALELPLGSNVGLQAFTCNAVPNPMVWAGLHPVYIDCGNDFNMDLEKLKAKTDTLKAVLVQHTFGLPANMDEITGIAQERNWTIIEDCAHALGAEWQGRKVGTFSKAAFFSFARDKVISCVYGGMAVTNDDELGEKLRQLQQSFGQPAPFWVLQQLLHPILLRFFILPVYDFLDLGKFFLIASQWLHILSKAVSWKEKRGVRPDYFPKALPNALAVLALGQLSRLNAFYRHRKALASYYYDRLQGTSFGLPKMEDGQSFLRFTITHPKAHEIIYQAWHKENILLGDWYTSVIAPADTDLSEMKYRTGMCPNAERLAQRTLNLPTHSNISNAHAQRIITFLEQWK